MQAGLETTLVSLESRQAYSGMVPGMIGGRYEMAELSFDLGAICRRAGAAFIPAEATRIVTAERRVILRDGTSVEYDLLSIATGSMVEGADVPGVAERTLRVKPIGRAGEIVPALVRAAHRAAAPAVVVAGAGAAGIEVGFAARARLRRLDRPAATVTLVESGSRMLGGRAGAAEGVVSRALAAHGIALRLDSRVSAVFPDSVRLHTGHLLSADVVVWATGAAAPPLLRESGLATDPHGFLLVDDRLRSVSDPAVFGAGDAATLASYPATPKAGVYAVREGPVLWKTLLTAATGGATGPRYRPQPRFLALLNTGDGRAIASYGRAAVWSSWGMQLKDWIDRRFMRRFQALERA